MAEDNYVSLIGRLEEAYYEDLIKDKIIYNLNVIRKSGTSDIIPVAFTNQMPLNNEIIKISGTIQTYIDYKLVTGKKVFTYIDNTTVYELTDNETSNNFISVIGQVIKEPWYRTTPMGKILVEMPVIIDGNLIHCVAWKELAAHCNNIHKDDIVKVKGRLQSREYTKEGKLIIAYEISSKYIEKYNESKKN